MEALASPLRAGDIANRSTSDSEASAELDAAACAVEILHQRETVNELLLRFTWVPWALSLLDSMHFRKNRW